MNATTIIIPTGAGIAIAAAIVVLAAGLLYLALKRSPAPAPVGPTPAPKPSLLARAKAIVTLAGWPTKYAVIASLVCGAITVLNQTTFGLPPIWKTSLTWALGLFAFLGIGPTLGPKFRAALHLPPKVATAISVVLMAGMVITQQDATMPFRAVIIGVIQVAGGLGFDPTFIPTL